MKKLQSVQTHPPELVKPPEPHPSYPLPKQSEMVGVLAFPVYYGCTILKPKPNYPTVCPASPTSFYVVLLFVTADLGFCAAALLKQKINQKQMYEPSKLNKEILFIFFSFINIK